MRGLFITFEGIEGCGKTTQCRRVAAAMAQAGHDAVSTREPGDTPIGAKIRSILLDPAHQDLSPQAELLLYCADRAEHMTRCVLPNLQRGRHVLCDRYSDATRAYQGHARELGLDLIDRVNVAHIEPDLTLLLDLPVEVGLGRARARNTAEASESESRFEQEALAFHRRVAAGYHALAAAAPDRIVVIAADRPPDLVFADVWVVVQATLTGGRRTTT